MGEVHALHELRGEGQRYVRVTEPDRNGYVEFQFSIGDPTLYLEMTLPHAAFEEFCAEHNARRLTAAEARAVDAAEHRWRFGSEEEASNEGTD